MGEAMTGTDNRPCNTAGTDILISQGVLTYTLACAD